MINAQQSQMHYQEFCFSCSWQIAADINPSKHTYDNLASAAQKMLLLDDTSWTSTAILAEQVPILCSTIIAYTF